MLFFPFLTIKGLIPIETGAPMCVFVSFMLMFVCFFIHVCFLTHWRRRRRWWWWWWWYSIWICFYCVCVCLFMFMFVHVLYICLCVYVYSCLFIMFVFYPLEVVEVAEGFQILFQ